MWSKRLMHFETKERLKKILRKLLGSKLYYLVRLCKFNIKFRITEPDIYRKWKSNKFLKDSHKGERCFILGNGPSLKDVDLSKLADEFVFTVNFFTLINGYQKAKANAHIFMDGAFFDGREDAKANSKLVQENYNNLIKETPFLFVPLTASKYVKKIGLDSRLDIKYVYMSRDILEERIENIDLTKGIYSGTNVIQYAIQIAIYMGFSQINLLGCDATNILVMLNNALGSDLEQAHAYSPDKDDCKNTNLQVLKNWDMSQVFYDQYRMFVGYEKLNSYCIKESIELINCTPRSLLKGIQKKSFDEVLKG